MSDLVYVLVFAVLPTVFAMLTFIGDGSPMDALEKIWNWIVNTVEATWFLLTSPLRRSIPKQADYDVLNQLLEWNRLWDPPERGDFYVWDPRRQVFEEIPLPTVKALGSGDARLKDSAKEAGYEVGDRRYKTLEEARRSHSDVKAAETSGRTKGSIFCDGCGEFRRPMLDGLCGACYRKQSQYAPQKYALGETVTRVGSWCKSCNRDAHGEQYCDRCKEIRLKGRTRVSFDDLPDDAMIRMFSVDGHTANCTKGQLRQARRRYWFELGERGFDAAMYAAMQILIGDEILNQMDHLPADVQEDILEQIRKLVVEQKRCAWCGSPGAEFQTSPYTNWGNRYCDTKCLENYYTEP